MFEPITLHRIVQLLPASLVEDAVRRHGGDRYRKRFRTRAHLLALLMAQLGAASSLRDVETLTRQQRRRLHHSGGMVVPRSTLSHANNTRPWQVFADIAQGLIARQGRGMRRRLGPMMAALDSTPIRVAGRGSAWAEQTGSRHGNQGLKLHLMVAADTATLQWAQTSDMNVNDISMGREISLEEGHIYLFDKGYCDYNWWRKILDAGADFVTRLKRNAAFKVIEERACDGKVILSDQIICLTNTHPRAGAINRLAGRPLRLVRIPHPGGKKQPFLIVSSLLDAPAEEVAEAYRKRWRIEVVFKWLKQNLKVKRFMGESRNAILVQLWVAIIAWLLLRHYHRLITAAGNANGGQRLKDTCVIVTATLFHPPPKPPRTTPATPVSLPLFEEYAPC